MAIGKDLIADQWRELAAGIVDMIEGIKRMEMLADRTEQPESVRGQIVVLGQSLEIAKARCNELAELWQDAPAFRKS